MSAGIAKAVKQVAQPWDDEQSEIKTQRGQSPHYMPTERTSTASYKSPRTGKKKPKPVEPESLTTFSAAIDYISSPVRYLTSVFTQPIPEPPKSPPKPRLRPRKMAKVLDLPSPKPVEIAPLPEVESAPISVAEKPSEIIETYSPEIIEPIIEKKIEFFQNVGLKEKRPVPVAIHNKKSSEPKRSSSQLLKTGSKTRVNYSTRNFRDNKRHSPSPTHRMPSVSPRILSASSIKFASNNNRSYRVTSTETEELLAAKGKKTGKKVFKIDKDKSTHNVYKHQASPTPAEKREEITHNYVPLNAIEISRL